ncbi:deleted in malignant brain tumors 1 protein [Amia ocellicauda]|uniref:deleted in malignant brain tumors 1 protein n=1 Tax=Amia ocellicauda TaxID=2972642 RepID=UPI0034639190
MHEVHLQKPNISISPSTGDVTKGQNFSITCRSASLHPNGTLNLLQATGGAVTTVRSQSVGNGSVTFRFPSSVFSEDGSYSCQYQTQVSGRTINSSLSDPAQITVTDVVCRQLGCGAAVSAPHGAVYGKGSGPILLSDVGCTGGETVLSQCPNRGWRSHNCTHGQDTSVICFDSGFIGKPSISLLSPYPTFIPGETPRFSCIAPSSLYTTIDFDLNHSSSENHIVTQRAGSPQTSVELTVSNVDLSHQGSYSCQYRVQGRTTKFTSPHSNPITITVVHLQKPNISISPSTGDVTKGQNFSITCRSASLHPNGKLNLLQSTGGAVSTVRSQSVGNGSVTFRFPSSVFSEDGSYSCQYQTQVSRRTINSSLSDPAQITVTDLRVTGGDSCAGRVEVYHRGDWGTVCDDDWGLPDADVVCRQLGCGAAVSAPHGEVYGQGSGPILLDNVGCTGGETVLSQCPNRGWRIHNCNHGEDASVICFNSGTLGKAILSLVSDYPSSLPGESVTFSCTSPSSLYTSIDFDLYRSSAGKPIMTRRVVSPQTSVELTVYNMNMSHQGSYSCQYRVQGLTRNFTSLRSDSISITVVDLQTPNISLSDSSGEVTVGHTIQITCSTVPQYPGGTFLLLHLSGAERQWMPATSHTAVFTLPAVNYSHDGNYSCQFSTQVSSRTFNSLNSSSARVTVIDLRLQEGHVCAGRVEVYYRRDWGTVCEDGWGLPDADVVCRQLGCGAAVSAPGGAVYGQGSGPILLDNVGCSGGETVLSQCPSRGWRSHNCSDGQDASVICLSSGTVGKAVLSLVTDYPSFSPGESITFNCTAPSRLYTSIIFELYRNSAGNPIVTQRAGSPNTSVELSISNLDPSHQGSYSCQYRVQGRTQTFSSNHSDSINIFVVVLETPRITTTAPNGEVSRGQNLQITCSTPSQYPGGSFHLLLSGSKFQSKLAINHVAIFDFSYVDFHHGGSYRCQYQTQVAGRLFKSPETQSVPIAVKLVLHKPIISLDVPSGELARGDSFTVTCSTAPQYPDGTFYVLHNSLNNGSFFHSEPAHNHTAFFAFAAVDRTHAGDYRCQYQAVVSGQQVYSPESDVVVLAVKEKNQSVSVLGNTGKIAIGVTGGLFLAIVLGSMILVCKKYKRRETYDAATRGTLLNTYLSAQGQPCPGLSHKNIDDIYTNTAITSMERTSFREANHKETIYSNDSSSSHHCNQDTAYESY